MSFNFSSLLASIESFFGIVQTEPAVLVQSADQIISAAQPAIDAISPGAAESAESHINTTAAKLTTQVAPYLQDAAMAEPLVNAVVATLASAAATATKTTAATPAAS